MSKPDDELIPPPPPSPAHEIPPKPDYDCADEDVDPRLVPGQQIGHPPAFHDSERRLPPPVSGSID